MFPFPRSTKKNGKPNIIPQLIMCISISRGRRADVKVCFIKTKIIFLIDNRRLSINYSYLMASIGSKSAAFLAGYHPKKTPVTVHTAKERNTLHGWI